MRTRPWVVLAISLALTGCNSTSDEATSTTGTTAPETTTTTVVADSTTTTAPTTPTTAERSVTVFFSVDDGVDCSAVAAFERHGPSSSDPIRLAFDELLSGPTPEEESEGAGSFFSEATADSVISTELDGGLLSVDFTDIRFLNNASTSCGSLALISSLSSTAFQFDQVERVRFTILGSCSLFWNWLQTECSEVTRDGTVATPVDVSSLASESGCAPGSESLPDGRWFGYVTEAAETELIFDLACWFNGGGAIEAALVDGAEVPPPNDYYIRNESTDVRTIEVAPNVSVRWLPDDDITNLTPVDYQAWIDARPDRPWLPGVWLDIADGTVSSIEEQYQP